MPHPQVETRKELTTVGKQHLSTYAGQSVPFAVWLSGAEERLRNLGPLPRSKERLFSCVEEFQVRETSCAYISSDTWGLRNSGTQKCYSDWKVPRNRTAMTSDLNVHRHLQVMWNLMAQSWTRWRSLDHSSLDVPK